MTIPTNDSFAEEIKSDRLKLLNYFVIGFSGLLILGLFTFGSLTNVDNATSFALLTSVIILFIGSWLSNFVRTRQPLIIASWIFIISPLVAMSILMLQLGDNSLNYIPFVFPIIVFIGGLLVSPVNTIVLTVVSVIAIIWLPSANAETFSVVGTQVFGSVLTMLAAALAALVTGELYQVTQWAIDNYSRERRTNEELFDKRQELTKSLKRAEVLGERLQDSNAELERANAEAEEAKHFRGQFLANMSHELRTPLNAIIGFSETMLQFPIMYDNEKLPDAYERDLSQIYNSGRQLLHVINDILDLAKVDAGKLEVHMQEVEAGAVVNAVMSTAKGLLGSKDVRLNKDFTEPIPHIWGDESRLRQVLLNLYSNACKYTDEGAITLKITEQDHVLEFALSDTGIGIDPEYHETLFEEFQQAKAGGRDPRSGSGLGLAISRELLELMGGRIWMESTPGEGSTFYFTVHKYENQEDMTLSGEDLIENRATENNAPVTEVSQ